jgi:hypothetical protein
MRKHNSFIQEGTETLYEATEISPVDRPLPHLPRAVKLPPPAYFLILSPVNHSVHTNAGSDNHVINFDNDKRLGLVHTGHEGVEGSKTGGREREAFSAVIPTISRTFTVASV